MKISKKVLNRVEGEVELKLKWKKGRVEDAFVIAPSYRGFEEILRGRPALDAVVITPRVCGICGHAHLMASTGAIEDALRKGGIEIQLSEKALKVRELTLSCELIQNHLRWFYLYLFPDLIRLESSLRKDYEPLKGKKWFKAIDASNKAIKVIAIFGGQWPHTSYAVPGGVTCDPTRFELGQAKSFLEELREFLEEHLIGMDIGIYLSLSEERFLEELRGDMEVFKEVSDKHLLHQVGTSYGRFISSYGVLFNRICKFDLRKVKEDTSYSFLSGKARGYSWSKSARYNGYPCETGPLARKLTSGDRVFRHLYRLFGDSVMVRVLARIDELVRLSERALNLVDSIELSQPSWVKPPLDIDKFSGSGVGIVEASRGTLIHKVKINRGRIESYDIITPTVWNLGPRDERFLGVVEKAIVGVDSQIKAEVVLRSFDVCSVCTSH